MENIFENTCLYTRENLLTVTQKTLKTKIKVIYVTMAVLCLALGIFAIIRFNHHLVITIFGIALILEGIFAAIKIMRMPYKLSQQTFDRNTTIYHEVAKLEVSFHDKDFCAHNKSTGKSSTYDYIHVIRVTETKTLILLSLPHDLCIPIDKSGFTKGNSNDFVDFIAQKCVFAQINRR